MARKRKPIHPGCSVVPSKLDLFLEIPVGCRTYRVFKVTERIDADDGKTHPTCLDTAHQAIWVNSLLPADTFARALAIAVAEAWMHDAKIVRRGPESLPTTELYELLPDIKAAEEKIFGKLVPPQ